MLVYFCLLDIACVLRGFVGLFAFFDPPLELVVFFLQIRETTRPLERHSIAEQHARTKTLCCFRLLISATMREKVIA
jgi:small neutral amino acid transporter SnatA (MarC family)